MRALVFSLPRALSENLKITSERFMDIGGFVFPYGASIVALVAQERVQICVVSSLRTNGHGWACVLIPDL